MDYDVNYCLFSEAGDNVYKLLKLTNKNYPCWYFEVCWS